MVTAIPPFDGDSDKEIITAVKKGQYTLEVPEMKNISSQCKDLIRRILVPEAIRPTIEDIFSHPWMRAELPHLPLQLNFRRLAEFGAYSKVRMRLGSSRRSRPTSSLRSSRRRKWRT